MNRRRLILVLGILSLIALIWMVAYLVGPMWMIGSICTGIVLFVVLMVVLVARIRAVRESAKLEKSLKEQAEAQMLGARPDERQEVEQLTRTFAEAVETLRSSKLGRGKQGRAALYQLPWYVFIGPPGAGKTTSIVNSGLDFPLGSDRVQGVGGTRHCDWFFSSDAILLDTAGRYTIDEEDRDEWMAFLDLIKKYRTKKPINGVIVGISITDLLDAPTQDLEWHADNIRGRIDELISRLGVRFPVYVLFTKCDLVQGFVEFFEDLTRVEREQIWGATLSPAQLTDSQPGTVFEEEYDLLLEQVERMRTTRLSSPMKRENRRKVYVFPLELASMKENFSYFMQRLFRANPYLDNPIFRGFYFTSGTQEGVPIDQVIQAIARQFDLSPQLVDSFDPETETKAYFIQGVFTDVIIPDRDLAVQSATASRFAGRARLVAGIASAVLLLLLLFWMVQAYRSSNQNLARTTGTAQAVETVSLNTARLTLADFARMDSLQSEIEALEEEGGKPSLLGLYHGEELIEPLRQAYERRMRPLIETHGLQVLEDRLRNPDFFTRDQTYTHLKDYLLLGAEAGRLDTLEQGLLTRDLLFMLEEAVPGLTYGARPQDLRLIEDQYEFFLDDVRTGRVTPFVTNEPLVENVRATEFEEPSIEGTYALLKRDERVYGLRPYTLTDAVGPVNRRLFAGDPQVPGLFTKAGWMTYFREAIALASESVLEEDWVTGKTAADLRATIMNENELKAGLEQLYFDEYAEAWREFLREASYEPVSNLNAAARLLERLGDNTGSPLIGLMNGIAEQTRFSDIEVPGFTDVPGASSALGQAAGQSVFRRFSNEGRRLIGAARADADSALGGIGTGMVPGLAVEVQFGEVQALSPAVAADRGGVSMLGVALDQFAVVGQTVEEHGGSPEQVRTFVAASLPNRPEVFSDALLAIQQSIGLEPNVRYALFEAPVEQTWNLMRGTTRERIGASWRTDVYEPFQASLAGRYPFDPDSPTDASIQAVEDFFHPESGILWTFYRNQLATFVQRRGDQFVAANGFPLSTDAQLALEKAWQITQTLFHGGSAAQMTFALTPDQPKPDGILEQVVLVLDGKQDLYRMGGVRKETYTWPSYEQAGAVLEVRELPAQGGQTYAIRYDGQWGWFRLLERADIQPLVNNRYDLRWRFERGDQEEVVVRYLLDVQAPVSPFDNPRRFFTLTLPPGLTGRAPGSVSAGPDPAGTRPAAPGLRSERP